MTGFWNLGRVASATGATLRSLASPSLPLRAVCTDSRSLQPGDLFVALRGENFDGHTFLSAAKEQGAAALLVSDADSALGLDIPVLEVADTLVALGALGNFRRRGWGGPLVAVAGSNGKTSTKELLAAALGASRTVHFTRGNFNNRIGVPLTLLAIPDDAEVAVVEVGTNSPGEVAILRDICEPQIAVVTSIGEEHLEGLLDLEGVLAEESSVFDGVDVAVVPSTQPEIGRSASGRAGLVVSAGLDEGDVRAGSWRLLPDGTGQITIDATDVHVPLRGIHNMRNAMLAIATASHLGLSLPEIARGMESVPQPHMRMAWEEVGDAVVLNDAYNANPPSMRAALELVAVVDGDRQRVAVLGTMRELGEHAGRLHREVARFALASPLAIVAGVGDFADALLLEGPDDARVVVAQDVHELWPLLRPRLDDDALILLKGSRGARLERLLPYITEWAGR